MSLGFVDILKLNGFDPALPTRMLRHKDARYPVDEMRRNDWLELYQCYQDKPVFHGTKQIVTFYGITGKRATFYGVYKNLGHSSGTEGAILSSCPLSLEWKRGASHFYDLQRDERFDEFRDRLIIDWPGPLAWNQTLKNNSILEVLPPGRRLPPFVDYLDFSLTFIQLKNLFEDEEAHRDWRIPLSSVAGVYLILAENSGDLYVGSAYGVGGIWARWRQYAKSGDGGNVQLRDLIAGNAVYPERFRFSILQILPKTMTFDAVVRREGLYKHKLGTRATGLNSN
jgi:hypothetical protein